MKNIRIALVIKTEGLEYDDRIRKEILSIQKLYPSVSFKIFAMLPDNLEKKGMTSYGVPYRSVFLPAREKYASSKKVYLKGWQFYKAIKKDLRDFDAVWTSNVDTFFVAAFVKTNFLIWDLHELPYQFFGSKWKCLLLKYVFKRCDIIIHANPQRAEYLKSIDLIDDMSKHYSLRNYPKFDDIDNEFDGKYENFLNWKGNRQCVYLQGIGGSRAGYESISAVLRIPDLVAVVVGNVEIKTVQELEGKYGDIINKRILFIGKIPQLKIPQFVRNCYTSLVFYQNTTPNNYYCEANRFYQAVIMGLPVVVGCNPTMKEIVDKYGFGVSIDNDGSDIDKIVVGLKQVINNYNQYKNNVLKNRSKLLWDNQDDKIKEIIDNLLKKQKYE